jgi:hypothetical protein
MSNLRTAAQQALEALEKVKHGQWEEDSREGRALITALKAALAEPVQEPVQEPVAWRFQSAVGGWAYGSQPPLGSKYPVHPLYAAPPQRPAEPVQEPVAWAGYDLDGMVEAFSRVIEAHYSSKHPFHNPINMDAQTALRILRGFIPAMKAYATPPQRKPLTDEEKRALADKFLHYQPESYEVSGVFDLISAVERAHKIGGEG